MKVKMDPSCEKTVTRVEMHLFRFTRKWPAVYGVSRKGVTKSGRSSSIPIMSKKHNGITDVS
ncbi:unnamed protein product [Nesidiocoris tenuis]|uniref:Uncharacterized protein n=1 Tax=Nesidiocoris tenuis TaxID=355587 RepID=A0A6H5GVY6_9HEMI|nr:unnamed protein product [Nesidiocoris tenuis]